MPQDLSDFPVQNTSGQDLYGTRDLSDFPVQPEQKKGGLLTGLMDAPREMYESVNRTGKLAAEKLKAGDYPGAFRTIIAPVADPIDTVTKMNLNLLRRPEDHMPVVNLPKDQHDLRMMGTGELLGVAGVPGNAFKEAWEAKDYPRMAGQGIGALATLGLTHKLGGYLSGESASGPSNPPPSVPPFLSDKFDYKDGQLPLDFGPYKPEPKQQMLPMDTHPPMTEPSPYPSFKPSNLKQGMHRWGKIIPTDIQQQELPSDMFIGPNGENLNLQSEPPPSMFAGKTVGQPMIPTPVEPVEPVAQSTGETVQNPIEEPIEQPPTSSVEEPLPDIVDPNVAGKKILSNHIIVVPNEKATPEYVAQMGEQGYELFNQTKTHSAFRVRSNETGAVRIDLEAIRNGLRKFFNREPSEEEVQQEAFRRNAWDSERPRPNESTGNVAPFEPKGLRKSISTEDLQRYLTLDSESVGPNLIKEIENELRRRGIMPKPDYSPISDKLYEGWNWNDQYGSRPEDAHQSPYPQDPFNPEFPDDLRPDGERLSFPNSGLELSDPNHPLNRPSGPGDIPTDQMNKYTVTPDGRLVKSGPSPVDEWSQPTSPTEGQGELPLGPSSELTPRELPQDANLYPSNEPIPTGPEPTQGNLGIESGGGQLKPEQQNLPGIPTAKPVAEVIPDNEIFSDAKQLPLKLRSQRYWDRLVSSDVSKSRLDVTEEGLDPKNLLGLLSHSYAKKELALIPKGEPGLSVEPDGSVSTNIVYRGPDGTPIAAGRVLNKMQESPAQVLSFVADKSKGLLYGRGVLVVAQQFKELGAFEPTGMYTKHTVNFIKNIKRFLNDDSGSLNMDAFGEAWDRTKEKMGWGQGERQLPKEAAESNSKMLDEALGLGKNLASYGDYSATLRQGLPSIATKEFWKSIVPSMKAGWDKEIFDSIDSEIRSKKIFQRPEVNGKKLPSYADSVNFRLLEVGQDLSKREQNIASNWIENGRFFGVPDNPVSRAYSNSLGRLTRGSNRAFTTLINYIGANRLEFLLDRANDMSMEALTTGSTAKPGVLGGLNIGGKDIGLRQDYAPGEALELSPYHNLELGREISDYVKTTLGQAPLKSYALPHRSAEVNLEWAAKGLGRVLFAPRMIARQVRMLNPNTYIMASPFVRKQYMKSMLATAGAWLAVTKMGQMAGAQVSWDANSADFGKMKVGNTRFDLGAGFLPYLVWFHRMATGQYRSSQTNKLYNLGEGFKAETIWSLGERFAANKLEPFTKYAHDLASASENTPFHVLDRTAQIFVPLAAQDLYEIARDKPELLPVAGPAAIFGAGVQTYDRNQDKGKFIPHNYDLTVTHPAGKRLIPKFIRNKF